ncbi:MAG: amidohydrolase family protein, partial [Gemmatimonadaceae bacterium]|nr:amidohydrolase family protein [Gemmatimonadaceae bacterium]
MRSLILPLALAAFSTASAQSNFGNLAAGPYDRLVIRGAMVIPGHGGPPAGPYDIVIERNVITQMIPFDPVTEGSGRTQQRPTGDRVIDATGKYVMPGMIDLHTHIRTQPQENEYAWYLRLAHGVTGMVNAADRGLDSALYQQKRSADNTILAPRMWPIWGWGSNTSYRREQLEDPRMAPDIAREMVSKGARVVSLGTVTWDTALFGAVARAVWNAGGITTIHLPPSTNAVVNAVKAACLGATMIEHHYGYAESALDRQTQNFERRYNYDNENDRFRAAGTVWLETDRARLLSQVADSLVKCGATMLPTRVVYEANRDFIRSSSLPWLERYTHQSLINWNLPNPAYHGSFHYDWTSDDEYYWTYAFRLWGDLIAEFNRRGGRVAYGTDDNYIWATPGFSAVRELQLLRETGMHSLEVLKAATKNSAETLREPKLGLVRPGYLADLVIVDGNPAYNLKFLYSFGDLTLDREGRLTIAEHGNRRVTRLEKNGVLTVLADRVDGKRLNSPNDLLLAPNGDLYFTDPPFGLPRHFDDPAREMPFAGVYRRTPDGALTVLV